MASTVTISDDGAYVRAVVELPGCPQAQALAAFTDADVLERWWGGRLRATLEVGGEYCIEFPDVGRTMTGMVAAYEPPSDLAFTWEWDDARDVRRPPVHVAVQVIEGSPTVVSILHGPHPDDDDGRTERAGHRSGWAHFLPRLETLMAPGQSASAP